MKVWLVELSNNTTQSHYGFSQKIYQRKYVQYVQLLESDFDVVTGPFSVQTTKADSPPNTLFQGIL